MSDREEPGIAGAGAPLSPAIFLHCPLALPLLLAKSLSFLQRASLNNQMISNVAGQYTPVAHCRSRQARLWAAAMATTAPGTPATSARTTRASLLPQHAGAGSHPAAPGAPARSAALPPSSQTSHPGGPAPRMPCTSPGKGAGKGRAGDQGGAARGEQGGQFE